MRAEYKVREKMIHLLRSRATKQQVEEMAEELGAYIKLAVDVQSPATDVSVAE